MKLWVYSFYDPESGELLHKGTAKELSDAGAFYHPTRLSNIWAKYQRQLMKGIPQKWRIEREKQEVKVTHSKPERPEKPAAPKRSEVKAAKPVRPSRTTARFAQIKNPSPLQRDVHDLCLYNEEAERLGKRVLDWGIWVSLGKPATP